MPKKKKKPYFHNNVEAYQEAPAELFESIEFEDFIDWKIKGYEIPSTVLCIIREYKDNGKIKEHVYQRRHAANRKMKQLVMAGHRFNVIDQEGCQEIIPTLPEYDDPLA